MRAKVLAMTSCVVAFCLEAPLAHAQHGRRRFDPEDLQFEEPGTAHADLQVGVIRGPMAGRWVAPDFSIDIGLTSRFELGIDGFVATEGTTVRPWAADHGTADNLWLSSKLGLFEVMTKRTRTVWAGGLQLGPKIAAAPDAHGAGFEGIVLFGFTHGTTQLIGNIGGFVDPGTSIARGRPVAIEGGFDFTTGLGKGKTWHMVADVSALYSTSGQPGQLQTTFGPQVSVCSWLDLSPQALIGFLSGTDRWGALLVISPRFTLAHAR